MAGKFSNDRAAGALVGLATGDALGAGYEFGSARFTGTAQMIGGGLGGFAPGEWTDDTSMAVCIAQVAATGHLEATAVAAGFLDWYRSDPPDIGIQTREVLGEAADADDVAARSAARFARLPEHSAGNGALMRTAPVALAHLGDDTAILAAAHEISALTHADPVSGEACALWCIAIDRAIREQRLDGIRDALPLLADDRAAWWHDRLDEAEHAPLERFRPNGYVVTALQAAHGAIATTPVPDDVPAHHLQDTLHRVIGIGDDTDTTAAIAGQLLGARWGVSAIPFRWRRLLHGWPGLTGADLARLATLTVQGGRSDASGWPGPTLQSGYAPAYLAELPGDDGVLLGNLASLEEATGRVDAVISLCRVGTGQVPSHLEHHEIRLIDLPEPHHNPNLGFVLTDTAAAIPQLRAEGKRVFLHCVDGRSRTPTVAATYLAQRDGISGQQAWQQLATLLPDATTDNTTFQRWLSDLHPDTPGTPTTLR